MTDRPPTAEDLVLLATALEKFKVNYALIGGAAMSVHGFPRAPDTRVQPAPKKTPAVKQAPGTTYSRAGLP
jgi:hypothetical protein